MGYPEKIEDGVMFHAERKEDPNPYHIPDAGKMVKPGRSPFDLMRGMLRGEEYRYIKFD